MNLKFNLCYIILICIECESVLRLLENVTDFQKEVVQIVITPRTEIRNNKTES